MGAMHVENSRKSRAAGGPFFVIGLMCGTSMDGVDAALLRFETHADEAPSKMIAYKEYEVPAVVKARLQAAMNQSEITSLEICKLHEEVAHLFATSALNVCEIAGIGPEQVTCIGSHGQTIAHCPVRKQRDVESGDELNVTGSTLQIGHPSSIAQRTGIPVVGNFRVRDMCAQGQGAPLMPWVDSILSRSLGLKRVVWLNLGGIANITLVQNDSVIAAFDTGPANMLMDAYCRLHMDDECSYDANGNLAAQGAVHTGLLQELLKHPFFSRNPPKSTGAELFGVNFLNDCLCTADKVFGVSGHCDLLANLCELTAESVCIGIMQAIALADAVESVRHDDVTVLVSGGGAMNKHLVGRISRILTRQKVCAFKVGLSSEWGINSDAKEALGFGCLAWAFLHGRTNNCTLATGATSEVVCGEFAPGCGHFNFFSDSL